MALVKTFLTSYGYAADYWKISSVTRINGGDSPVHIVVEGYKDHAARENGSAPLRTRAFQALGAAIDAIEANDELSKAYIWLKSIPAFADAVDA